MIKKQLLLLILLISGYFCYADPIFNQNSYRWRNDNGSQTSATWKAGLNTPSVANTLNQPIRLRMEVDNSSTSSFSSANASFNTTPLQYRKNAGAWVTITTSTANDFYFISSANVSNGAGTSQQTSSGTFAQGIFKSNDINTTIFLNKITRTEIEYSIATSVAYDKTATYNFQLANLNNYIQYPTLNPNPSYCSTIATPTASNVSYVVGQVATALTATTGEIGLLWYTVATGGTGVTTAPTPSTATSGNTSYWVSSTNANGCESARVEIVVTVILPATHLNFDGVNDIVNFGNTTTNALAGSSFVTAEAWINIPNTTGTKSIVSNHISSSTQFNLLISNNTLN